MAPTPVSIPIIDSHIHLFPASELDSLAWMTPDGPLAKQHSLEEYAEATGSPANLRGFIFLETDRKNDESKDWTEPLAEIAWLRRIAAGEPRAGEGHAADDAKLVLGIVPWAPLNLGPAKLEEYLKKAETEAGPSWDKVKGLRYLVQDKPNGTMLTDEFIEGLKVLGRKGLVFDLGVDQHRRGRIQLEETVEMIDRAHEDVEEDDKVVFILNHLCKPDLSIINQTDPAFIAWRTAMFTLSKCKKTYMKLSGCLQEMSDSLKNKSADEIFSAIFPWLAVVLAAFGPSRIMFGSDWPVCTIGVKDGAWTKWHQVVARMCDMASLGIDEQTMIWSGTAKVAYKLDV